MTSSATRRSFMDLAYDQWSAGRFLCVGLDTTADGAQRALGVSAASPSDAQAEFNRCIVDATSDLVGAYKPNSDFYEAQGADGVAALRETIRYIQSVCPDVPVILDAKRADIGSTNVGYAEFAFEYLNANAITVHPFLGAEALAPLLERTDRGVFVLCRTSNPGAGEFQDLEVEGQPLYEAVATRVAEGWNERGNCGLVVGATYPGELARVRALAGAMPILIPGIGAQGGDLEASVRAGFTRPVGSIFLNASRSVLYASSGSDFASAARAEVIQLDQAIRLAAPQT